MLTSKSAYRSKIARASSVSPPLLRTASEQRRYSGYRPPRDESSSRSTSCCERFSRLPLGATRASTALESSVVAGSRDVGAAHHQGWISIGMPTPVRNQTSTMSELLSAMQPSVQSLACVEIRLACAAVRLPVDHDRAARLDAVLPWRRPRLPRSGTRPGSTGKNRSRVAPHQPVFAFRRAEVAFALSSGREGFKPEAHGVFGDHPLLAQQVKAPLALADQDLIGQLETGGFPGDGASRGNRGRRNGSRPPVEDRRPAHGSRTALDGLGVLGAPLDSELKPCASAPCVGSAESTSMPRSTAGPVIRSFIRLMSRHYNVPAVRAVPWLTRLYVPSLLRRAANLVLEHAHDLELLLPAQRFATTHDDAITGLEGAVNGDPVAIRDAGLHGDPLGPLVGTEPENMLSFGTNDQCVAGHGQPALWLAQGQAHFAPYCRTSAVPRPAAPSPALQTIACVDRRPARWC